jgi:hypothetical protein
MTLVSAANIMDFDKLFIVGGKVIYVYYKKQRP